jgi:hypothetical protein
MAWRRVRGPPPRRRTRRISDRMRHRPPQARQAGPQAQQLAHHRHRARRRRRTRAQRFRPTRARHRRQPQTPTLRRSSKYPGWPRLLCPGCYRHHRRQATSRCLWRAANSLVIDRNSPPGTTTDDVRRPTTRSTLLYHHREIGVALRGGHSCKSNNQTNLKCCDRI